MKKLATLCLLSFALTQVATADDTNTFTSNQFGFTVNVPLSSAPATPDDEDVTLATFDADNYTLEIDSSFYTGSLQDYEKDLAKIYDKDSIKKKTVNADSLIYETVEKNDDDENVHSYTKYIKKGSLIYSAVGTAYTEDWDKVKAKLMANVDSFKLSK